MMHCANPSPSNSEMGMRLGLFTPMISSGMIPPQAMVRQAQQACGTLHPSSLSRQNIAAAATGTWQAPVELWQVYGQQSNDSSLSFLVNDRGSVDQANHMNHSSKNLGPNTAAATTSTLYAGTTPSLAPHVPPTGFSMCSSNTTMVGQNFNAGCGTGFPRDTEDVDNLLLEPLPLMRDSLPGDGDGPTASSASEILINADLFQQEQDELAYSEPVIHNQDHPSFRQQSIQRIVAVNVAAVQQDITSFDLEPTPIGNHWSRWEGECSALKSMLKSPTNGNVKTDTKRAGTSHTRRHNDHQGATPRNNNVAHVCVSAGRSCTDLSCSCLERLLAMW